MDPSHNETFDMQLPAPVESAPAPQKGAEKNTSGVEKAPAPAEQLKSPAAAPAAAVPPIIPLPTPTPIPPAVNQASAAAGISLADDNDLIEKEWVNKAKAIIERTRDDPYRQSEELTMVKADYMQKRYNKTIKVSNK